MKKTVIAAVLASFLAPAWAFAGKGDGPAGHKHPPAASKKSAGAKKAEAVYRKAAKEELGKRAVCPVTGEELKVAQGTISMSYKGKNYYFCCPGCDKAFMENPEKYAAKEKAAAKKYVCPMGCAESDQPGRCPKCGMALAEKKAAKKQGKKQP